MAKEEEERSSIVVRQSQSTLQGSVELGRLRVMSAYSRPNNLVIGTYDHRSVRTGHPVRNHNVSIVFVIPGTKML
jgi:hypothetical protein